MHQIIEDVYICSALFVAITCAVVLFTTIPKTPYRLYEHTIIIESLICLPFIILETRRSFRYNPRTLGGLAVITACCRGVVFAFGFHYLWNYSSFGLGGDKPPYDFDLIESLVGSSCIALGLGILNSLKKLVCFPNRNEKNAIWQIAFGWSLIESAASLQCEASVGLCLMMLIVDWRRRRVIDVLVLPEPLRTWTFGKFLVFMSRLTSVPLLLRHLYVINLCRVSPTYFFERRVLTIALAPLAMIQILAGAWYGLGDPHHRLQVFVGSAYLALLMLGNFLLNIRRVISVHYVSSSAEQRRAAELSLNANVIDFP